MRPTRCPACSRAGISAEAMKPCDPLTRTCMPPCLPLPALDAFGRLVEGRDVVDDGVAVEVLAGAFGDHLGAPRPERRRRLPRLGDRGQIPGRGEAHRD